MPDQGAVWVLRDSPSEKRQTLEFDLKAANVNTFNIFTDSGSDIFPELVTVTFVGIMSSKFFTRGYFRPHHLIISPYGDK